MSLLPFLVIIPLAIWLKEIVPGLIIGLIVGAFCLENGNVLAAMERAVNTLVKTMSNFEHIKVVAFLYLFGSLIGMIQIAGGVKGFVQWIGGRLHSKQRLLLFIWLTVPFTFFMPMFRIMLLSPVIKSILGKFRVDRRRIAYMIDVSTEPIIVLLPAATAFAGFMESVVAGALAQNQINASAYSLFLASLPYNFFAVIALVLGLMTTFMNVRIGSKERKREKETTNPFHQLGLRKELALVAGEPLHLFFPLFLMFVLTFFSFGTAG